VIHSRHSIPGTREQTRDRIRELACTFTRQRAELFDGFLLTSG
jgi:hypothetical protein